MAEAAAITSEDFLAGLLAALALRDWETLSIRGTRFDAASAAAYEQLRKRAADKKLELDFYVRPDAIYGDSTVVRDALARLAQWDLISLDNPEYQVVRLKMSPRFATTMFGRLRLDQGLFEEVADRFVRVYEQGANPA